MSCDKCVGVNNDTFGIVRAHKSTNTYVHKDAVRGRSRRLLLTLYHHLSSSEAQHACAKVLQTRRWYLGSSLHSSFRKLVILQGPGGGGDTRQKSGYPSLCSSEHHEARKYTDVAHTGKDRTAGCNLSFSFSGRHLRTAT